MHSRVLHAKGWIVNRHNYCLQNRDHLLQSLAELA